MTLEVVEDIRSILDRSAADVSRALDARISKQEGVPPRLAEAMRYSLLAGGKRLRPVLALWSCEACGGQGDSAMPAAMAIECVHTFSLIHDDLPALDDDDYRRSQPSNHVHFGEALAILAGDALSVLAFEILTHDLANANLAMALSRELAEATGGSGLIGGEVLDLEGESIQPDTKQVKRIGAAKTGRLIQAACRMGAMTAGADDRRFESLSEYGRAIGLAFQVADDLLDVTGSIESVGKRTGKDEMARKQTYPRAIGIEASRQMAADLVAQATVALSPFGESGRRLAGLAHYMIERIH